MSERNNCAGQDEKRHDDLKRPHTCSLMPGPAPGKARWYHPRMTNEELLMALFDWGPIVGLALGVGWAIRRRLR
jgi:hypothetical protein